MEHQNINNKASTSSSESEASSSNRTCKSLDEERVLLDNNVKDSPNVNVERNLKQHCHHQLHKMIAEEPVKLSELKPIIDNFANDDSCSKDDTMQHQTKFKEECIIWLENPIYLSNSLQYQMVPFVRSPINPLSNSIKVAVFPLESSHDIFSIAN